MQKRLNRTLAFLLISLTAGLLASCGRQANPATPTPDTERAERYTAYFDEADTNSDGVIDEAEIDAVTAADFDDMDFNDDGVVTIEDIYNDEQGEPEGAVRNLDLSSHLPYDSNGDGSITQAEYEAYLDTEIQKADSNSDGQITLAEYRAYEEF